MKTRTLLGCGLMAIGLTVLAAENDATKMSANTAGDDAEKMIAAIKALEPPALDRSRLNDANYIIAFTKEHQGQSGDRDALIKEFYRKFPDHPQAFKYMAMRWQALTMSGKADAVLAEIDEILAANPPAAQRADLLYGRAMTLVNNGRRTGSTTAASAAIDAFIKELPKDQRGGELLFMLVIADRDSPREAAVLQRIVDNYGDTPVGKMAQGKLRQEGAIGQPCELSFTDAISGKPISMADLKGKIVVLDFWATWCGPCVAEMPKMKELYAEYKDKGVEFIGISLDNPGDGLAKLKDFVTQNDIPWPQYYQGQGGQSAFSSGWGVNSIPCVFVVDAAGNLYSTEARGKVAKIISTLLAKR
jgi:thiol-disulfide isomerase/thioredoxin